MIRLCTSTPALLQCCPLLHTFEHTVDGTACTSVVATALTTQGTESWLAPQAQLRSAATAATDPQMPVAHTSSRRKPSQSKFFWQRQMTSRTSGCHLAEQRAMHSLLRHQTQAVKHCAHTRTNSVNATTMLPPVVRPVSQHASLLQEWPLARLSV